MLHATKGAAPNVSPRSTAVVYWSHGVLKTMIGVQMDIKETANDLIEQGKAALDANGDGKVEAKEVVDALAGRVKETAEAAAVAADEIKQGFDADADGKVSLDEVKVVADGVAAKAKEAVNDITEKFNK